MGEGVPTVNPTLAQSRESGDAPSDGGYAQTDLVGVIGLFRSRASLEGEIVALRHQLNVLRRKAPKRLAFSNFDRLIFASLYRISPTIVNALVIIKPETVIRWHRAGFRLLWRWKSRRRGGRPKVPLEIRRLIRDISLADPLWGAPRIHGELLKLGIDIGQTSVAKYMARCRKPPSQGWKTLLRNHADGIASPARPTMRLIDDERIWLAREIGGQGAFMLQFVKIFEEQNP